MSVQSGIENKLAQNFDLLHLEVENESSNHNVPPGSESHFKVVLVSNEFDGKTPVMRHRAVNKVLAEELANRIHALALHTYTEQERNVFFFVGHVAADGDLPVIFVGGLNDLFQCSQYRRVVRHIRRSDIFVSPVNA